MDQQIINLLVALAIRLAPVVEEGALKIAQLLVDMIPGDAESQYAWGVLDITRGITTDHPDWEPDQVRRYVADACAQLALDMEIVVDPKVLTSLGLSAVEG